MKKNCLLLMAMLTSFSSLLAQEPDSTQAMDSTVVNTKEVKNRNVMLSAESSTSPRNLNIGLPFAGDILILENDLPVVYTFWTQMPMSTWRYDNSIGRIGVMSFAEGALTFGKVGYVVTSWDRDPGNKVRGYASINTNNYGSFRYDMTMTGPISKNGWGFMVSANETYERGSGVNLQYTPYVERAEFFKGGISKKYKSGNVKLLYKYASSKTLSSGYSPFVYEGNGKVSPMPGFKPGKDSYVVANGKFPYYDYNTGERKWGDLDSDEASRTISHTIYLTGEHRFKNKMKLTYSSMFMASKAALTLQYPISIGITDPDQRADGEVYTIHGTDNAYDGPVQLTSAQYYPQVKINTFQARAELTKQVKKHNLRGGLTFQNYNAPEIAYGGVYYQTVEKNPKILDRYYSVPEHGINVPITEGALLPSTGTGSYTKTSTTKTALYVSDDLVVNNWLNGGVGARLELENTKKVRSPYQNEFQNNRPLTEHRYKNKLNKVFTANVVAKATRNFGFLADATYNEYAMYYGDYPENGRDEDGYPIDGAHTTISKDMQQKVLNLGGGVYWNYGDLFSIVSKVTSISKKNNLASLSVYDKAGNAKTAYPIIYDIQTLGWTTDIITSPFQNFNLHLLFTLQNPQYKNYTYKSMGEVYSYNNKVIPELSKVLIEIDPSYYLFNRDVRVWASLRYFGKQYGNTTNAFEYNGWWESFGGIDYRMSRSVDIKAQVTNIFGQNGVKGSLVGGDQITDASSYIGRKFIASGIRPRTFEVTVNCRF